MKASLMSHIDSNGSPSGQGFLVTEFTNDGGKQLTKTIGYKNGKLEKGTEAKLNQGSFRTICFESVREYGRYIRENRGVLDKAFAYGVNHMRKGIIAAQWMIDADLADPLAIKRSNENFPFLIGQPGFLFKDLDGIPGMEFATAWDYDQILCRVFPWFAGVQRLYVPSGSSHLYHNGVLVSPKSGYHLHVGISDASKAEAFGKWMFQRLFDAGHGYQLIQKDGDRDPRTLSDRTVWQGSRLDFAFGARLLDDLVQDFRGGMLFIDGTRLIDVTSFGTIPPDMDVWKRGSSEYVRTMREIDDQAARVKLVSKGTAKDQIIASGVSDEVAQAVVDAAFDGDAATRTLYGEFILYRDNWEPFTVDQALADPDKFSKLTFRPPLDPLYGMGKAQLHLGSGQDHFPTISAFWHGMKSYRLETSARAAMGGALFVPSDNAPQIVATSPKPRPAPPAAPPVHGLPPHMLPVPPATLVAAPTPLAGSPWSGAPTPTLLSTPAAPVVQGSAVQPLMPQPVLEKWQPPEVAPPPVAAPTPLAELREKAAPTFPLELLPPAMRNWVINVAARRQCPPEMVAIPMLATLAGGIGHGAGIEIQDGWIERAAIWAMVICPKSSGKTESQKEVTFPLFAFKAAAQKAHKQALAAWAAALTEGKATMAAFKQTMKKNPAAVADGDATVPSVDDKPTWDPLVLNSPTLEGLMRFQESSRGLTLIKDELTGMISNMSRYNGGDDRPFYLEMYNGGPASFERANHDIHVDMAWLSILGGIQPHKAKTLFTAEGAEDDGMLERFQCMTYPARNKTWAAVKLPVDRAARDAYAGMVRRLHETPWGAFLHPAPHQGVPPVAKFSADAQAEFDRWLAYHMPAMLGLDDGDPLLGFWGKAQGFCGRLALVLHLTKWASTPAGFQFDARTIDHETVASAINLVEQFFKPTWSRTLGAFSNKSKDHTVVKVADWITDHPDVKHVTVRDIIRKNWTGLQDHDAVQRAFTLLVDHGWLVERRDVLSRGGRPTTNYDVMR